MTRHIPELSDTGYTMAPSGGVSRFERFERKFQLPPGVEATVSALLRAGALQDRGYPEGEIDSIYFDTLDLESYGDALNDGFCKQKVRLTEWTGGPQAPPSQDRGGRGFPRLDIRPTVHETRGSSPGLNGIFQLSLVVLRFSGLRRIRRESFVAIFDGRYLARRKSRILSTFASNQ